jgi:glycerophosphoryl diester phosphodiesterase
MFSKVQLQNVNAIIDAISLTALIMPFVLLLFSCAHNKCKNNNILNQTAKEDFSKENYHELKKRYNRPDNVFGLYKPLVFAHRGGALEAPESTLKAFNYAKEEAGVDILELDVQLTRDGEFVVWHGPDLDNVYIKGLAVDPKDRPKNKREISDFNWRELKDGAWVADPCTRPSADLSRDSDRKLLLLSEFLSTFDDMPLNIEMKGSFSDRTEKSNGLEENIDRFLSVLNRYKGDQKIVVASRHSKILKKFRDRAGDAFTTNLSLGEQLGLVHGNIKLKNRVLETTYFGPFSSSLVTHKVNRSGSSTFVFLTGFGPIPSIDDDPSEEKIFKILEKGVDGIMTDRPKRIREIIKIWLEKKFAYEN